MTGACNTAHLTTLYDRMTVELLPVEET